MRKAFLIALMLMGGRNVSAQVLTIATSGHHTLSADLSGAAVSVIAVNADNVVLDLNGKTIRCTPIAPSTAVTFGIAAGNRANITIRNGAITGCMFGINAAYGSGVVLESEMFHNGRETEYPKAIEARIKQFTDDGWREVAVTADATTGH